MPTQPSKHDHDHFEAFDPEADVEITERLLPHWFQPGVATFITMRTADSLPREVLLRWEREQLEWLSHLDINTHGRQAKAWLSKLPVQMRREFQQFRDRAWHWHLDDCHGECLLRRPDLATIVSETLLHFDGVRYDLDSFVVMPNHVHLLVQFRPPTKLRSQCTSWMRYSARQINQALGRHGSFWQGEPFDHLVRSAEQFSYFQLYMADNPRYARLRPGEYLYWQRS